MKQPMIAPSLLAADFANLQKDIDMVNDSQADWFHCDIMDGVFVPNISFGIPVVKAVKKHARKPLDVHLMIVEPDRYIEAFAEAGADVLTVHYEACPHLHRTLERITACGMKAGVVLNPHTAPELLGDVLGQAFMVLLMSVNPGFGGQKFIPQTYSKIERLKTMISREGLDTLIEVDGGVDTSNVRQLVDAGADVLVAGSFVFGSRDPQATIRALKAV